MTTVFARLLPLIALCAMCGGSTPTAPTLPSTPPETPGPPTPLPPPTPQRVTTDQPDDFAGAQIKVMYVVPSDGTDRPIDTDGTLATSVEAWVRWVEKATEGRRLKLDTFQGALDISFYRLRRTGAQISSFGVREIREINTEIIAGGFASPQKIYAVYYGGNHTLLNCGRAGEVGQQHIAGAFFEAIHVSFGPCGRQTVPSNRVPGFTRSPDRPGYWEFVMAHEVFHALGAVPPCAPNVSGPHVRDSATDLMGVFESDDAWDPQVIDYNRDDYYRHGRRNCLDVAQSPYFH
jgi:hypothetical protein